MTLNCLVIRKFSGNYQVNYTGTAREIIGTQAPAPVRRVPRTPRTGVKPEYVETVKGSGLTVTLTSPNPITVTPITKEALPGSPEYDEIYTNLAEACKVAGGTVETNPAPILEKPSIWHSIPQPGAIETTCFHIRSDVYEAGKYISKNQRKGTIKQRGGGYVYPVLVFEIAQAQP